MQACGYRTTVVTSPFEAGRRDGHEMKARISNPALVAPTGPFCSLTWVQPHTTSFLRFLGVTRDRKLTENLLILEIK